MNLIVLVFAAVLLIVGVSAKPNPAEEKYTTKYDNIDLDQILKSDRLLKNYIHCLLEKGNCTPDGAELKQHLADALQTECAKCSQAQKDGSKKVLDFLIQNKKDWYHELEAKYDPDGSYRVKYEKALEN